MQRREPYAWELQKPKRASQVTKDKAVAKTFRWSGIWKLLNLNGNTGIPHYNHTLQGNQGSPFATKSEPHAPDCQHKVACGTVCLSCFHFQRGNHETYRCGVAEPVISNKGRRIGEFIGDSRDNNQQHPFMKDWTWSKDTSCLGPTHIFTAPKSTSNVVFRHFAQKVFPVCYHAAA